MYEHASEDPLGHLQAAHGLHPGTIVSILQESLTDTPDATVRNFVTWLHEGEHEMDDAKAAAAEVEAVMSRHTPT